MTKVLTALSTSLDGADDRPGLPLGVGGERLFAWLSDGDAPSRLSPMFKMSAVSAAFFDAGVARVGAAITGAGPTTCQRRGAGADRCLASRCSWSLITSPRRCRQVTRRTPRHRRRRIRRRASQDGGRSQGHVPPRRRASCSRPFELA